MKSLLSLMAALLEDSGRRCGVSTARDLKSITSRVEHEGLSFFTIALPEFSSYLERCLEKGSVGSDDFPGYRYSRGLPAFLQGFLSQVFDRGTGQLLNHPSSRAIREIRQICRFFSKLGSECSPVRVDRAFRRYVECEQEMSQFRLDPELVQEFQRTALVLWADLFSWLDETILFTGSVPKHGPGATADKLRGNMKYRQSVWPVRSTRSFPVWENLAPSDNPHFWDRLESVRLLEPEDEMPVKVIAVPKTQKTPRIIAMEPTCMQYMQQGLLELIQEGMRKFDIPDALVRSDDQSHNQRMAKEGSFYGRLATLDLSDASDRVSWQLVKHLLRGHGVLLDALDDCRSRRADVPGYGVLTLSKFASMGSAVCFPIEALVFSTIAVMGVARSQGVSVSALWAMSLRGSVRVYGDDIIVPSSSAPAVMQLLEDFGLKVNRRKSFWTGKFRESCGKDYFAGDDVSVVKCRAVPPASRSSVSEVISAVSLRNQLSKAGYWAVVEVLDEMIGRVIPFPFIESEDSPLLGRIDPDRVVPGRFDDHLQVPQVRGVVVKSTLPASELDDVDALMKFHLKRSKDPYEEEHLHRSGRSSSVALQTRWATPF